MAIDARVALMRCVAIAARSNEQCKHETVGEADLCDLHLKMKTRGAVVRVVGGNEPERVVAESPVVSSPIDDAHDGQDDMFAGLPRVDAGATIEEIAAAVHDTPIVDDREELERVAKRAGIDVGAATSEKADTSHVDRAAAERIDAATEAKGAVRDMMNGKNPIDAKKIGFYIRVTHNPVLAKLGKEPATEKEVEDGASILAEIIGDIRGGGGIIGRVAQSPWARLAVWGGTFWGVRYIDEITAFIMDGIFGQRSTTSTTPATIITAAPGGGERRERVDAEVTSFAGAGFGVAQHAELD